MTQKLGERFAVRVHVDEDEATPGVDLHTLEMDVVLIQAITPILTVDDFGVAAIEIVLPAVEATHEMLGIAAALRQPSRAMRADVVVGLEIGRASCRERVGQYV